MTEDGQEAPSESPSESDSDSQNESIPAGLPRANMETRPRAYVLINRMNLNGVLSSRLIAPRESFHKYYSDLLELCCGWVPILTELPGPSLLQKVVAEPGAGGPVLLELADDVIGSPKPDGPVAYVHAVPFSKVSAIHFPDDKSLREHRARGYKNVHPHEALLRVSPELFSSGTTEDVQIAPPDDAPTTDWTRIDRIRGAVNGVLAASDSGEALATAAIALGAGGVTADVIVPAWLNWSALTGRHVTPGREDAQSEADRLIFEVAYQVLGRHDKAESWSPGEILDQVADATAAVKPSDDARKIIDIHLRRVRELLSVEREFEPFRNPESPYVAAKSLLMVLLRPDLEQLLAWPFSETGADETTRSVAALFAGCLRGLSRESVNLRNAVMDDLLAEWAVREVCGGGGAIGPALFVATEAETELLIDGRGVEKSAPLLPDPVLLYQAMAAKARAAARVAVCRGLGWPVTVRVLIPAGSEIQSGESAITITSVESVKFETSVDEAAFLDRLRKVRGVARKKADALLSKTK